MVLIYWPFRIDKTQTSNKNWLLKKISEQLFLWHFSLHVDNMIQCLDRVEILTLAHL